MSLSECSMLGSSAPLSILTVPKTVRFRQRHQIDLNTEKEEAVNPLPSTDLALYPDKVFYFNPVHPTDLSLHPDKVFYLNFSNLCKLQIHQFTLTRFIVLILCVIQHYLFTLTFFSCNPLHPKDLSLHQKKSFI